MSTTKTKETTVTTTNTTTTNNPYASLQNIEGVRGYDPQKDKALFQDLRKVLEAHDAVDRFGVTLLHNHFDIESDEQMIETHDEQERTLTLKPYRNIDLKEGETLQATNWRFDEETGGVQAFLFCVWDGGQHRKIEI